MSVSSTPTARRWFRAPLPLLEPLLGAGPQLDQEIGIVDVRENAPGYMSIDEWPDIYLGADNAERLRERAGDLAVASYVSRVAADMRFLESGIVPAEEVAAAGFARGWTNETIRPGERWANKTPEEVLADLHDVAEALIKGTSLTATQLFTPLPMNVTALVKYTPVMDPAPRVAPWMFGRVPIVLSPLSPAFTRFDDIEPLPYTPMSRCRVTPLPRPRRNPKRAAEQRWRRLHKRAMRLQVPGGRAYVKALRVATRALARYQNTPERE